MINEFRTDQEKELMQGGLVGDMRKGDHTLCNTLQHTQHTATHCSSLQHTATHCDILQHTAKYYNILQHTATHCNTLKTLQHNATYCDTLQHTATHYHALQYTVTHCSTLQHIIIHCNTLQHTAIYCNTLHHTARHVLSENVYDMRKGAHVGGGMSSCWVRVCVHMCGCLNLGMYICVCASVLLWVCVCQKWIFFGEPYLAGLFRVIRGNRHYSVKRSRARSTGVLQRCSVAACHSVAACCSVL